MNTKPRKKDKKLHLSDCVEHFSNFSVSDQNSLMVWVSLVSIIVTGIWINSSAGFMIARFFGNTPEKKVHQLLVVVVVVEWGGGGGSLDTNIKHGISLPVHINAART